MSQRIVLPDGNGDALLTIWQAAWLSRATTETVRRWLRDGSLTLDRSGARLRWRQLVDRAVAVGDAAPAHWSWLNADLREQAGTAKNILSASQSEQSTKNDQANLNSVLAALATTRLERDQAKADAENLDQAVMAYRDNWRRRTEPQTSDDLNP
jgi:hypothetical protein